MRGSWLLLLAICAVPAAARAEGRSIASGAGTAIVGGEPTDASEYPATGALTAGMRLRCTATLIAPDVVLTAAHCLEPAVFGYLGFTLDPDLSDGAQGVIKALVVHPHPDFDNDTAAFLDLAERNDIGIMILERPVEDLPPEQIDLAAGVATGTELDLCGYGRNSWGELMAGTKRDARVGIARTEEHEVATTAEGPQPCSGDSGGPLYADTPEGRTIAAVISRAVGASRMCDTGAIATRVAPHAPWIAEASADRDVGCAGAVFLPFAWPRLRRLRRRPRS